jgi:hypothetical protein
MFDLTEVPNPTRLLHMIGVHGGTADNHRGEIYGMVQIHGRMQVDGVVVDPDMSFTVLFDIPGAIALISSVMLYLQRQAGIEALHGDTTRWHTD